MIVVVCGVVERCGAAAAADGVAGGGISVGRFEVRSSGTLSCFVSCFFHCDKAYETADISTTSNHAGPLRWQ